MDISLASSILFSFFQDNDSYNTRSDYKRLNWKMLGDGKHGEDECQAAINICLEDMVKNDFVRKIEKGSGRNKESTYIILNSLKNSGCDISLSYQTVRNLKTLVNSLLPMLDLENDYNPDGKDIEEGEIILILEAISILSNQLGEKIKELEEKDKLISELKKNQKPPAPE